MPQLGLLGFQYEVERSSADCLRHLPVSAAEVSSRSHAPVREESLMCCGEEEGPRFRVIGFANRGRCYRGVPSRGAGGGGDRVKPLTRIVDDKPQTDQEYAGVCFGSNRARHCRKPTDRRFLAIREPLRQGAHGDTAQLPSRRRSSPAWATSAYKMLGVVTNPSAKTP